MALAPTNAAPAEARADVTAWLGHQPGGAAWLEDARLLVSEMVTNSVRHAELAWAEPLHLRAWVGPTTLHLELHDAGTRGSVAQQEPRRDDGAGGFGLQLVADLSSAWGVERDGDGTTVWLELAGSADGGVRGGASRCARRRPGGRAARSPARRRARAARPCGG